MVCDGAKPNASIAGYLDAGNTRIEVPRYAFSNFDQKKTLYCYVEVRSGAATLKLESSYPAPQLEVFRRLLARVIWQGGCYEVVQEQHGAISENYHNMFGGIGL